MTRFTLRNLLLAVVLLSHLSMSFAGSLALFIQQHLEQKRPLVADKSIHQAFFQQRIDHNNLSAGYFSQRYYIDETYSLTDDSPVFFYLCGEAACTKRSLNGAIRTYAQKHHAKLVALEHRYYGESLPFQSFSTENLAFLTTEAALDDLAYFQRHLTHDRHWIGTWIAFGGSYPGSLSAYYRLKFPYLVQGALASSAPVMAKENFIEYDAHVTQVAGPQCANQMRQVVREVEYAQANPEQFGKMKALFDASAVNDPVDFLYLIADTGAAAIQYGMRDEFCNALAKKSDPLMAYADFAKTLYQRMGVNAVELTAQGAMSEDPAAYNKGIGMRQWYYQSCKEYGYWQNAHPDPSQSSRSAQINLAYHQNVCQRLFGLTSPTDTATLNNTLYYPLMDELVSRIYFTNGENDPWSTLSLAEKNGNAMNSNLSYQLIKGAAHCDDLHTPDSHDSKALKQSRKIMLSLLDQWLKN